MPTIFILFGFRFMFYANDHEPIHVHVIKGDVSAKFTLFPVTLIKNNGLKSSELKLVESVIEENQEVIAEWKIQCKLPPKTKGFCPLVLK